MRSFPPRLPHQPIFYPVTNSAYARQIARDWNTLDEKSGFAGFVLGFEVENAHIAQYVTHIVGDATHEEYWIPAAELEAFNPAISSLIEVFGAYFGPNFRGYTAENYGLAGKDAVEQFVALAKTWDYSSFDVVGHISTNRKALYLNYLSWLEHDFTASGIDEPQKLTFLEKFRKAWELNRIEVPLPEIGTANS